MADSIDIEIGGELFSARFQDDLAPQTCAKFRSLLPWRQKIIHVRWSGEACWIPLGDLDLGLDFENATRHPQPGEIIFYPGGISETELLLAYGGVSFSSKAGPLAGNPFLIIEERLDQLTEICRRVLWEGAKDIVFGGRSIAVATGGAAEENPAAQVEFASDHGSRP